MVQDRVESKGIECSLFWSIGELLSYRFSLNEPHVRSVTEQLTEQRE